MKLLRRTLGDHIALRVAPDPALPDATADVGMVEQVLLNLAVNARDAMPGGGELAITTVFVDADADYLRRVPQAKPGQFVGFRVTDTGVGIPPEVLRRVFDPFFTTKPEGKGTGLGLATVYTIAQQHGGWVEISSAVGRGSQFVVWFPARPRARDAGASAAGRPGGPAREPRACCWSRTGTRSRAVLQSVFSRNGLPHVSRRQRTRGAAPLGAASRPDRPPVHRRRDAGRNERPRTRRAPAGAAARPQGDVLQRLRRQYPGGGGADAARARGFWPSPSTWRRPPGRSASCSTRSPRFPRWGAGGTGLAAVLGEPAFRLDGGLAAHARGGDRLAVDVVGAVARDIDPGKLGPHLRSRRPA